MNEQKIKEKGITLVALVVTIVVLLILAGVTITSLLGDNGIIRKAQNGAQATNVAVQEEMQGITNLEEQANAILNGTTIQKIKVEEAKKDGTVFENKTSIVDKNGNLITIPAGFKVASDSGVTVQEGIVIEDVKASTDVKVQGSQYVWIPIGSFIKDSGNLSKEIILGRYLFNESSYDEPELMQNAKDYEQEIAIHQNPVSVWEEGPYIEKSVYTPGTVSTELGVAHNATAYNLKAWIESAENNGGYYIGRYEASFASGSEYGIFNDESENINTYYKAASKISTKLITEYSDNIIYTEGTLWNCVSELEASKVSINTYADSNSVKSDLINSYAWDTAIIFIQEAGYSDYSKQYSKNTELSNTGTNNDNVCNIHDLASNLTEWTTENSQTKANR